MVISNDSPQTAISDYAQRWGIETAEGGRRQALDFQSREPSTLFGMFKTRGFCLESTHFTDAKRLSKLLALMSLAMCWAMKMGQWLHSHSPLKVKKHGRLSKSIFRVRAGLSSFYCY